MVISWNLPSGNQSWQGEITEQTMFDDFHVGSQRHKATIQRVWYINMNFHMEYMVYMVLNIYIYKYIEMTGNDFFYHPEKVVFSGMICDWVYHITEILEEHKAPWEFSVSSFLYVNMFNNKCGTCMNLVDLPDFISDHGHCITAKMERNGEIVWYHRSLSHWFTNKKRDFNSTKGDFTSKKQCSYTKTTADLANQNMYVSNT